MLLPDVGRRNQGFPADRRYAPGHTWLKPEGRRVKVLPAS